MKKVQITAEQEKALKEWMAGGLNFVSFVKSRYRGKWTIDDLKPLNTITPEQFSLMLNGWYEVEEVVKVGDWVAYIPNHVEGYYKVVNDYSKSPQSYRELSLKFVKTNKDIFKKVEPWKATLLNLGRKDPVFLDGDKYLTTENLGFTIKPNTGRTMALKHFRENKIKYFYPVESRIEVKNQ